MYSYAHSGSSDLVHRQIALACVGHVALGVFGFGCEDALLHLLNLAWPNFLENAPHCIQTFILAIEGLRLSLGPGLLLNYTLAVRLLRVSLFYFFPVCVLITLITVHVNVSHKSLRILIILYSLYCLYSMNPQGLFHPSRKVRNMYWKIYNLVYIGRQDALVAFYPRLPPPRSLPPLPLPPSEAADPIPSPYESCERDYTRYELEFIL